MNLNIMAPINSLGYGYTGLHIVDELVKLGHEVALFPIGQPSCHPRHQDNIRQAILNADKFSVDAPCIRIWHQHDMSAFVGKGKHIGFPIFELDIFTDKEKHHLASCDELMVCSLWGLNICTVNLFRLNPKLPTKIVPLGVDNEIFTPKPSKRKPTIFFNCGKWEVRKGHLELLEAFNKAFTPDSNVELWMMCENPFLTKDEQDGWISYYKTSKLGDKIRILPRVEVDTQVAEIMQQADCGVFPSRAEGWNLEALEMLACGKQVIATKYSAHTEFLNDANAWLVPTFGLEPAFDKVPWMPNGKWFLGQGRWGSLTDTSISILVEHMQFIHDKKQSGDLELNKTGLETAQKFSWTNTALILINRLQE